MWQNISKFKRWEPPPNFMKHKNSCSNHQKNSRITQQIQKAAWMDKLEDDLNGLQEIIEVFENLLASFFCCLYRLIKCLGGIFVWHEAVIFQVSWQIRMHNWHYKQNEVVSHDTCPLRQPMTHVFACFQSSTEKPRCKSSEEGNAWHGNAFSQHQSSPLKFNFWFSKWGKWSLISDS